MFIDRMFLMWHSSDAMSAATPAGITSFVFVSFFMGTAGYVNTFVAQYTGAGRPRRVGPAVWQGIYFALLAGLLMIAVVPHAKLIFQWFGHDPVVQNYEVIYFRIMCLGVCPVVLGSAVSCFFTGRGKTWTVLYVSLTATIVNIGLDYCLIFGNFGFPAMGIAGAAWATVIASCVSTLGFIVLFFRGKNRRDYATGQGAKPDVRLFGRLMKFGLPNGVQFMLDIMAFALFVAFVGRIGKTELAATNIAFQMNMLAFLPMIGFSIALTTMVGQALGKNAPSLAQRSTWSAFYMTFGYISLVAAGFWLIPDVFLYPFAAGADAGEFAVIEPLVKKLLCFVACYCLFDTGNIIFAATLKGAGDTRFVMFLSVSLSWVIMVVPSYWVIHNRYGPGEGLYGAWAAASLFVCTLAISFYLRFRQGKWKQMRVIEAVPGTVPMNLPEVPTVEVETP